MERIAEILAELIETEGVEYPGRESYKVYKSLLKKGADEGLARVVLLTLLAGATDKAGEMAEEELSGCFRKECYLKKTIADRLATMYTQLFSEQNVKRWEENEEKGFREFCGVAWRFSWDGEAEWDGGHVYTDCSAHVEMEIKVKNEKKVRKVVEDLLEKNPFISAEKLFDRIDGYLSTVLSTEMYEYVTSDDYYPPVMEDIDGNFQYELEKSCKEMGLKMQKFECDGDMSDFISKHERW